MKLLSPSVFIVAAAMSVQASGEVPLRSRPQLEREATDVIVGVVQRIYSAVSREGDVQISRRVAEVSIRQVEKGERLKAGQLVYARYWNSEWMGTSPPPPGSRGHLGPGKGDSVRVYLVFADSKTDRERGDKGFDVVLPNGFVSLSEAKSSPGHATPNMIGD